VQRLRDRLAVESKKKPDMPETLASRAFWPFADRDVFVSFGIIESGFTAVFALHQGADSCCNE
jgi:hypothetical protein